MAANRDLVLAGVAGGGAAGTALSHFAPKGSTAPTTADGALDAAFLDPGYVTEEGLTKALEQETVDIRAYGVRQPVRTLKTTRKTTFNIGFLESSPVALAVYHGLALDALVPDASGAFDFTEGEPADVTYAVVFDILDGLNHVRAYAPLVENTGPANWEVRPSAAIQHGVQLTAHPGSDGVAIHWFYLLNALATP